MADDIITRDSQGNLAVNTVSGTEANVPYNYDDCFTLDTNGRRALRVVGDGKSLAGNFINVSKRMPEADASTKGQVHIYTGKTDTDFTRGYIYECVGDIAYTAEVAFEPATISETTATCDATDFANFLAEWINKDITEIKSGTITYDESASLLVLVAKDIENKIVGSFQLYTEDFQDAGFTFTGTLEEGDVISFVCDIEEESANYSWERLQP